MQNVHFDDVIDNIDGTNKTSLKEKLQQKLSQDDVTYYENCIQLNLFLNNLINSINDSLTVLHLAFFV